MHLFFSWNVDSSWTGFADKLVHQSNVGERPSSHDGVVSSSRAVGIEFFGCQSEKMSKLYQLSLVNFLKYNLKIL